MIKLAIESCITQRYMFKRLLSITGALEQSKTNTSIIQTIKINIKGKIKFHKTTPPPVEISVPVSFSSPFVDPGLCADPAVSPNTN